MQLLHMHNCVLYVQKKKSNKKSNVFWCVCMSIKQVVSKGELATPIPKRWHLIPPTDLCIMLCCVMSCDTLRCSILCYVDGVLYCGMQCCAVLREWTNLKVENSVPACTKRDTSDSPHWPVLCCAVLCYVIEQTWRQRTQYQPVLKGDIWLHTLTCAVLCCAVLCCAVLCCAMWLNKPEGRGLSTSLSQKVTPDSTHRFVLCNFPHWPVLCCACCVVLCCVDEQTWR